MQAKTNVNKRVLALIKEMPSEEEENCMMNEQVLELIILIKSQEEEFLEIVKKEYEKKGIEAEEDIVFKIAKNIGVAKDGLHLEYNMLEVSSRAVSLVIPYGLLKEIINSKSYLKDRR